MDTDGDLSCDTLDPDDDNDTILDGADIDPLDPTRCQDLDGDTCDDCSVVQPPDVTNDGPDVDADGLCDAGDPDGMATATPTPTRRRTVSQPPTRWILPRPPVDTDGDLSCDTLDTDDDNDTILDGADIDPLDPTRCQDLDGDTCDDCSVIQPPDTATDGPDVDADGICDAGDPDADGDGYSNADETTNCVPASDPLDPASSPVDTDGDLTCDTLDPDDDDDTILDGADIDPLDPARCQDLDGDTCDDCSLVQPPDTANDGLDTDSDGVCDAGDPDADGDGYSNADETTNCIPASDPAGSGLRPGGHRWRPELRHAGSGRRQRHHPGRCRHRPAGSDPLPGPGTATPVTIVPWFSHPTSAMTASIRMPPANAMPATRTTTTTATRMPTKRRIASRPPTRWIQPRRPVDTDGDLSCDTLDTDDDNDTILDGVDIDPLEPTVCQDLDADSCDDCSVVQPPDVANDGLDTDADGLCDAGDTDADGDGYSNADETTNCSPTSDPAGSGLQPRGH